VIPDTAPAAPALTSLQDLRDWIRAEISRSTGLSPHELAFDLPVHSLGLSSVHVVRLAGEIEERLAVEVDPGTMYDFDSIDALCMQFWGMHQRRERRNALRPETPARLQTVRRRPDLPTRYATQRTDWEQRLCAMWCDVLQVDQVGIHDHFQALGGDEMTAAEISERLWDLGVPVSVRLYADGPQTVAGLGWAIEQARGETSGSSAHWRLQDDAALPADLRLSPGALHHSAPHPRCILLTGATGYLGAYLLRELLDQTGAHVVCLVRGTDAHSAFERIGANLRTHRLDVRDLPSRVSVVTGDLTAPWMGLGPEGFSALAARIDAILHSAATVNFLSTYQRLKPSNVEATHNLLRLACADRPRAIPLHYISTLGVAMSTGYPRETPIREDVPLLHSDDLLNGYEQSKYVGDQMVWTAFKERGIPGAIYRPPLVGGTSDGTYHKLDEFLPRALKGCLQLGAFPELDSLLEMVPVDFVSKAIIHIAREPQNLNKAYFVVHPQSLSIGRWAAWHREVGFPARTVPWDQWKNELLAHARLQENAMAPFIDLLVPLNQAQACFPRVDSWQFRDATRNLGIAPPCVSDLLARYTRHFIESGYYDDVPGLPQPWRDSLSRPARTVRTT
jgi:thioester reductase-like protein